MTALVVIGGGPAAHRLTEQLARHGFTGTVTVLGAEREPFYNRALLGTLFTGTLRPEHLRLPSVPGDVDVRTAVTVTRIDRAQRLVHTAEGTVHSYDVLVLATGARPHIPDVPGLLSPAGRTAHGVRALRTPDDFRPLDSGPVVILGGGILGVESAFALRQAGHDVTLVHRAGHPMDQLLNEAAGTVLTTLLTEAGVRLEPGRQAAGYTPGTLTLDDKRTLTCGTLLLCTGVVPETGLARDCGLTVHDSDGDSEDHGGIVVDHRLRTDDPRIHAIGDCARYHGESAGFMTSAWEQAEALAQVLTQDRQRQRPASRVIRPRIPGVHIAVVGEPATAHTGTGTGTDEVVSLSDPARGKYARLVLRERRLRGAVVIGYPRAIASLTQLYDHGRPVPSDRLALLLGTSGEYAAQGELPDDATVCHCNNVSKKTLVEAWHDGARDQPQLAARTRATTGCGTCAAAVRALCGALSRTEGDRSR